MQSLTIAAASGLCGQRNWQRVARGSRSLHWTSHQRALQILPRKLLIARAEDQESSSTAAPPPAAAGKADDDVAAEQLLRRRKSKAAAPDSGRKGPTVVSPLRDQVYGGGPMTPEQRAENSVVGLLAVLFFVILAEGVFLAASGFLPEALDRFATDVVLPAFSPTLGVFLAISTGYGVWKTRAAPEENK